MTQGPLVSIVIANYNYARFLGTAIDSAVNQTYPRTEVIVVDDGSTDGSREIIGRYGDRITPVLKDNGGHTSAINAGFAASRGELVCWLDSDDIFRPNKVEEVVKAHKEHPGAVLIYHRMKIIDAEGVEKGRPWPPDVLAGSIRDRVARSGGWWPRPTSSAMAFVRSFLETLHPMPESHAPGMVTYPDAYAGDVAPFCGDVMGLPSALTLYRVHGKNTVATQSSAALRAKRYECEREELQETLRRLRMNASLGDMDRHLWYTEVSYLAGRDVSLARLSLLIAMSPFLSLSTRIREFARLAIRGR